MSRYRFYFLNADDRIVTVVDNAVCVDDAAAATIAVTTRSPFGEPERTSDAEPLKVRSSRPPRL